MTSEKQASQLPGDTLSSTQKARQWAAGLPSAEEKMVEAREKYKSTGIKGNDILLRLIKAGKRDVQDPRWKAIADNGDTDLSTKFDFALREYELPRDDDLTLSFQGYLIGWNEVDPNAPRGTSVSIFVTRRDKIITFVHAWQREKDRTRNAAAVHTTAAEAVEWLKEDGRGFLGHASREAWELACQAWPPLQGQDVERVE